MSARLHVLLVITALGVTAFSLASEPIALAQTPNVSSDPSLATCPARKPVLRIAGVFTEDFSPHPVETRFSSTTYAWLHQVPLFGVDPWEENVDPAYGVAESWEFLPGLRGSRSRFGRA
jgi:hypothetical protein